MKKSTLALSVAAALSGLSGTAFAITTPGGATATAMSVNQGGIGHQLLVPYFSANNNNNTLLSIVNTDTTNGKLVKVRFRGAGNSDDLYDFTLALSPGDVFAAAISKDAATGKAKFFSADTSCTIPAAAANSSFITDRVDPLSTVTAAAQTLEGYVEIITMADILKTNASGGAAVQTSATVGGVTGVTNKLFAITKHASSTTASLQKPTCDSASFLTLLNADVADAAAALVVGMSPPTSGLMGSWAIYNLSGTSNASWSGNATALLATLAGAPAKGNVVFSPQRGGSGDPAAALSSAFIANLSADPLLQGASPVVVPQMFDVPDLSTPYISGVATPAAHAEYVSTLLKIGQLNHEYVTDSIVAASTDVVMSQPSRRYHVAVNYTATPALVFRVGSTFYGNAAPTNNVTFGQAGTSNARLACLININAPAVQGLFNREEYTTSTPPGSFVISPAAAGSTVAFPICGEASVASINNGGIATASSAISGSIARTDYSPSASDVNFGSAGWMNWVFSTSNAALGIPMIPRVFNKLSNGTANYGLTFSGATQ